MKSIWDAVLFFIRAVYLPKLNDYLCNRPFAREKQRDSDIFQIKLDTLETWDFTENNIARYQT